MQNDLQEKSSNRIQIEVNESDVKDLKLLYSADFIFAIIYCLLFLWGFLLTCLAV